MGKPYKSDSKNANLIATVNLDIEDTYFRYLFFNVRFKKVWLKGGKRLKHDIARTHCICTTTALLK